MARILWLSFLLCSFGSSLQQLQSTKDLESMSRGGTITLSCSYAGGSITDNNYPRWIQQKSGEVPRLLIYGTSTRPSGIPVRFSGSRSRNTLSLTITGVLTEDEATYYCVLWTGSGFVFGGGTYLTVTGQPTVSPTLQVFGPSQEEIKSQGKVTLVCLIEDFYPANIQVAWKVDGKGIESGVQTTKPTKQEDKYLASSYLSVASSDFQNQNLYNCQVTHEGKTFEKFVSKSGSC